MINKIKEKKWWIIDIILCFLFIPLLLHIVFVPVEFNQFLLQKLEFQYNVPKGEIVLDSFLSAYSSGLNVINNKNLKQPTFENKDSVIEYVWSWMPYYAVVYPTEGFYYFNIDINGKKTSGNFRIADLDDNKFNIAYFLTNETYDFLTKEVGKEDGVVVRKRSNYLYYVTYKNKTVRFKIPLTDFAGPKNLQILPEEEFIAQIHDESGIKLFLLYNHNTLSFYEILNEEDVVLDNLVKIDENHLFGKRTEFIYYHDKDYDRKILIGVTLKNVIENNYLDGPADQVPFRTNFKDKLNEAYPNTLLGAGINEYGVYLNQTEWTRIAVSPYERYSDVSSLVNKTKTCNAGSDKSIFWTCLTKEWWNNDFWLVMIYEQLLEEGKNPEDLPEKFVKKVEGIYLNNSSSSSVS